MRNPFFSSKKESFSFGSSLKTDIHSHILPGIDDGAPDVGASLLLIDGLIRSGYERLIATPHVMSDHHPNTSQTILAALAELKEALSSKGYSIPVEAAAEYMLDENFEEHLEKGDLLTIGADFVLVETYFQYMPSNFDDILFQLKSKNYRVILAHPERYYFIDSKLELLEKLKNQGVYLQANALSFTGYYGKKEKEVAEKMLDAGLVDFIGTDLHHTRHLDALEKNGLSSKVIRKLEAIQNPQF